MSERDLSGTWFTGECERNISGAYALAVSDWEERMPTKQNIERSGALLTCSVWNPFKSNERCPSGIDWITKVV